MVTAAHRTDGPRSVRINGSSRDVSEEKQHQLKIKTFLVKDPEVVEKMLRFCVTFEVLSLGKKAESAAIS
ncbi:hypothetical protein EYF80_029500 [Liparis tanakae]|uniref:Uncharacterized protein n=1 Tax=Liparis tanakae TaxID=230148 RepID=A0A4Z2H300_9TELE|nr:hypothetical protein EYF80_029500 [Liparis tanakae]